MDRVSDLPHTADIGFEVEASSVERLFELAARGLVSSLGIPATGEERRDEGAGEGEERGEGERIHLGRPDMDRLLVAWLRELLHRATEDRLVPKRIRASVSRASGEEPVELEADVWWDRWTEETAPSREIKGITYHGLHVEERGGGWHARVFLDV